MTCSFFSGPDHNCVESSSVPHSCGAKNDHQEKLKYQLHKNDPPRFRGVYPFPVDPIPRRNCFDEEAMEFLQKGVKTRLTPPSSDLVSLFVLGSTEFIQLLCYALQIPIC